jgi:FixJ family two-component response regulator
MDQFINKPIDTATFVETVEAAAGVDRVRDSDPSRLPL